MKNAQKCALNLHLGHFGEKCALNTFLVPCMTRKNIATMADLKRKSLFTV